MINKFVPELYERCINLAMRMLEMDSNYGNNSTSGMWPNKSYKYQNKEVLDLADELYKKIKAKK